jgi:hypothetical protein
MKRDYNVALFPFTVILMGGVDGTFLSFLKNEKKIFLLFTQKKKIDVRESASIIEGSVTL